MEASLALRMYTLQTNMPLAKPVQRVLNLLVTILRPYRILSGHLMYRLDEKIRVEVAPRSRSWHLSILTQSPWWETTCPIHHNPFSMQQRTAHRAWQCLSPVLVGDVTLSPSLYNPIESPVPTLMSFDDFNTWFSQIATVEVPRRYRRPSDGQWFRILDVCFSLIPRSGHWCPCF